MNNETSINKRIKELREKHLQINQTDFAKTLNLKQNSISLIEIGKRNPSNRTISDICEKFNVSENWLRNGICPIFLNTPSNIMEQLRQEFNLDEFSFNLVYEYLKLDVEQRRTFRNFFYRVIEADENVDYMSNMSKPQKKLDLSKLSIDEKVSLYRSELEREEKVKEKSEVS